MKLPDGIIKLKKLQNGERVICKSCGKGEYKAVGGDRRKTHCFKCDFCGSRINLD